MLHDQSGSSGVPKAISDVGDVDAYSNGKQNIQPSSGASSVQWKYGSIKPVMEPPTRLQFSGAYLDAVRDKSDQDGVSATHSEPEATSERATVSRSIHHELARADPQQTSPPRTNRESPPTYDQALLSHHNTIQQQLNGFPNLCKYHHLISLEVGPRFQSLQA